MIVHFASAAALGAHRLAPKVITRPGGQSNDPLASQTASTWQMWASDDLTDSLGVQTVQAAPRPGEETEEDGAPGAAAPAADGALPEGGKDGAKAAAAKKAAAKEAAASKRGAKGAKGAKGADAAESEAAQAAFDRGGAAPTALERESDPTFRKMHIDYKPVLFNAGRRGGKGTTTPDDLLSPKHGDADTKKRIAAAGLFKSDKGPSRPKKARG